jgi:hypothetical protein
VFATDFSLFVDRKPIDFIPTSLLVDEINVDTGEVREVTYTTQLVITEADLEPLSTLQEEQAKALADYWAKKLEQDLMRQLTGGSSEFQESLRAAGAKV